MLKYVCLCECIFPQQGRYLESPEQSVGKHSERNFSVLSAFLCTVLLYYDTTTIFIQPKKMRHGNTVTHMNL